MLHKHAHTYVHHLYTTCDYMGKEYTVDMEYTMYITPYKMFRYDWFETKSWG